MERARSAIRANSLDTARTELHQALTLDPHNAEAYLDLGSLAFLEGNYEAAERDFSETLTLTPENSRAKALLAVCEKRLHQPSALEDLRIAFANTSDAKLREQVGAELADVYYQRQDMEKTAGVMQTLIALDPDNVDLLFFAQRVYTELSNSTLRKLALLAPDSARLEQLIAEKLINAGDAADALGHYRKALAKDPHLSGIHLELAETLLQSSSSDPGSLAEAKTELLTAQREEGDSATIEDELGEVAMRALDQTAAQACYERAYQMNHLDGDAAMGLARLLKTQGKPEEAVHYLRQAVEANPMSFEAHYQLAQVCRQLHLTDEAAQQMRLYHAAKEAQDRMKELIRDSNPRSATARDASRIQNP